MTFHPYITLDTVERCDICDAPVGINQNEIFRIGLGNDNDSSFVYCEFCGKSKCPFCGENVNITGTCFATDVYENSIHYEKSLEEENSAE